MSYTPGPWNVVDRTTYPDSMGVPARWEIDQSSGDEPFWVALAIKEDNARLIAAAPDLLDKLKQADALIMQMATVILNDKVADHIPFGLADKVNDWLRHGATQVIHRSEYGEL